MKEKINNFLIKYGIYIILTISLIIRIFRIEQLPVGLHADEAGMAYDSFCLSYFRTDRTLNHLPVYLINFGGGQSALYAYCTAIFIRIFGFRIFSFRITSVLFNVCAIFCIYLMSEKFLGKKSALLLAWLFSICPWNIMASRWGLDCNLLAPCSIISLWLLLRAEKWYDYIFAGIGFGITLYTYALSYLILPIFLFFIIMTMLYMKKITFKNAVVFLVIIGIIAIPLLLMILVNNGVIDEIKSFITIPKLPNYRSGEISFKNIKDNLDLFKIILINDDLPSDSIRPFGTIYNIGIILATIGFIYESFVLIKSVKNKEFNFNIVMYFLFLSVTIVMLIIRIPTIYKANAMCLPLIFFDYSAIRLLSKKYKIIEIIIVLYYVIAFVIFIHYYFTQYGVEYEYQVLFDNDMFKGLEQISVREELNNKKVIITTSSPAPHIYTLVKNPISPYEYNETLDENNNYGKYVFNSTEIEEDAVYLVRDNFDLVWTLNTVCGFKLEQYGVYYLLYK